MKAKQILNLLQTFRNSGTSLPILNVFHPQITYHKYIKKLYTLPFIQVNGWYNQFGWVQTINLHYFNKQWSSNVIVCLQGNHRTVKSNCQPLYIMPCGLNENTYV